MFKLRDEQRKALDESYNETFEDRLLQDVALNFYGQFEKLGEEKTRKRIRKSVERARGYKFRKQHDIARFVRMTFGLGDDFDTSGNTAFAREILLDESRPVSERLDEIKLKARREGIRQSK
ncbi:MAG: hypothetical protein ACYTHJ_03765 [Planctomycetota bacterium]|jgi:hypothetical protein